MKKIIFPLLALLLLGACQKDNQTQADSTEQASFLDDLQLVSLIRSVTSHDGSFDDVIDQSDCFSINFPYEILVNGEPHRVSSIIDLLPISTQDKIDPVFPISITFSNYDEATVTNYEGFLSLIEQCSSGVFFNDQIRCVDFIYPMSVAVFNPDTNDFETVLFEQDRDAFVTISDFELGTLASINFPIEVQIKEGLFVVIEDIESLKAEILRIAIHCE